LPFLASSSGIAPSRHGADEAFCGCVFNIIILGVCTAVARELRSVAHYGARQCRDSARVKFPDGHSVAARTIDVSSGGTGIVSKRPSM